MSQPANWRRPWRRTGFGAICIQRAKSRASTRVARFHTTPQPDKNRHQRNIRVNVEPAIGARAVDELRRRGHQPVITEPASGSRLCAVARDPATGILSAAADPRCSETRAAGR
ncbi:hypothetical protein ACIA6C_15075 [Streptomyces sp. NPDC051578]|uniref:hypothetical protein n=1 Tax=Streptomyces sp. NPDC051578 TaxID=3365662 RepID=UPI0037B105F5